MRVKVPQLVAARMISRPRYLFWCFLRLIILRCEHGRYVLSATKGGIRVGQRVQIKVRQQWSWRGLLFKARGRVAAGEMRIEAGEIILAKRDATIGWWRLHHTISSRRDGGKCIQDSATSTSLRDGWSCRPHAQFSGEIKLMLKVLCKGASSITARKFHPQEFL